MKESRQTQNNHWIELDILRGLAALFMIINHLGYNTLSQKAIEGSLLIQNCLFITSFAPVLFFFVTGVGSGIQSQSKKKANPWQITFNKVIILILADLLIQWSQGRWIGLDFLGFIGLSSLVLELIRKSKKPLTFALIGIILISGLRYLIGPILHNRGLDLIGGSLTGFILGTYTIPGISYPLSPWLVYPLIGYLIGVAAMRFRESFNQKRWLVISGLFILGIVITIASFILGSKGISFFRWGAVGLGFYVASYAIICFSMITVLALSYSSQLQSWQKALSLGGISSLAVVPIHYFLIYIVKHIGGELSNIFVYFSLLIVVIIITFISAKYVENFSSKIRQMPNQKQVGFTLIGLFLLMAVATIITGNTGDVALIPRTIGQISLCLLFVVRWWEN